ncbi:MAG: pyridoxamine 5'-phosphate oxidase family protein [Lentimicrobium sp.]|nr:pyridoxamine 5'-phosphate oxidase family protein [Lentimicrobium sp.]
MRRVKQEITDKKIIDEILSTSDICRLGFIDMDRPYILPFNYGYKDEFIYIHCANDGKKIDLIKKNNTVCIEIEQIAKIERYEKACKWATTYRSVIGYGKVEIITDYEQKRQGLDVIMKHNGANFSHDLNYEKNQVDAMSILKVEITEMSGKQSSNWNENKE